MPDILDLLSPGWHDNIIYPGTHWLYYSKRGHYLARVDYADWTKGRFIWRVFSSSMGGDRVGFCDNLEDAKKCAETVLEAPGKSLFWQNKLF